MTEIYYPRAQTNAELAKVGVETLGDRGVLRCLKCGGAP
jgi:hypothetical protein